MTQGLHVEMGVNAPLATNREPLLPMASSGQPAQDSLFAHLLALLQGTSASDAGTSPVSDEGVVPPSVLPGDSRSENDLTTYLAAMLGLPVPVVAPTPLALQTSMQILATTGTAIPTFAPLPTANTHPAHSPLLPLQSREETARGAGLVEQGVRQPVPEQTSPPEGFVLPAEVSQAMAEEPPEAMPIVSADAPVRFAPVDPAHQQPVNTEAIARAEGNPASLASPHDTGETVRTPTERMAPEPVVLTSASPAGQRADGGAFRADAGAGEGDHEPAPSTAVRSSAKRETFTLPEEPSVLRSEVAAQTAPMEGASAVHRATSVASSSAREVAPAHVVRQVVQEIDAMVHQGRTNSVSLQLEPEHLGRLRVTISISEGAIHTHIVADNHAVRQMLESNSALLQQAFQERGLQMGALQVSVQGEGRHFGLNQPYVPPQPRGGWGESDGRSSNAAGYVPASAGGINLLV